MNMQAGNNIINAMIVLRKTYDGISHLMMACQEIADGKNVPYIMLTDAKHFLRYKSDNNVYGWACSSFISLFQQENKDNHNNIILGMDINLEEHWAEGSPNWRKNKLEKKPDSCSDIPVACLAKYTFGDSNISDLVNNRISPGNHWMFYRPLYDLDDYMDENEKSINGGINIIHRNIKPGCKLEKYYNLISVDYTTVPLVDINADNLKEKIFGTFDKLLSIP